MAMSRENEVVGGCETTHVPKRKQKLLRGNDLLVSEQDAYQAFRVWQETHPLNLWKVLTQKPTSLTE